MTCHVVKGPSPREPVWTSPIVLVPLLLAFALAGAFAGAAWALRDLAPTMEVTMPW